MKREHKGLEGHKQVVHNYILNAPENQIIVALDTNGRMLIDKLRKHIKQENQLFYQILYS